MPSAPRICWSVTASRTSPCSRAGSATSSPGRTWFRSTRRGRTTTRCARSRRTASSSIAGIARAADRPRRGAEPLEVLRLLLLAARVERRPLRRGVGEDHRHALVHLDLQLIAVLRDPVGMDLGLVVPQGTILIPVCVVIGKAEVVADEWW